jgi:hypothetical protein
VALLACPAVRETRLEKRTLPPVIPAEMRHY